MFRFLAALVVLVALVAGSLYVLAGRGARPTIAIAQPERVLGQKGVLTVKVGAPGARLKSLNITLEQDGQTTPLFALLADEAAALSQTGPDEVTVSRPLGRDSVPALKSGPARIAVEATRDSVLGLRTLSASDARDVTVRLDPPRVSVVSTAHHVSHGGAEMVVYRVTPGDVTSGVRVGDAEYPGYPAAGAGVIGADPNLRVAFFALAYDQDLATPIAVFARDEAGNAAQASFINEVFPKRFARSRIPLDDRFLARVVPEIVRETPSLKGVDQSDLVASFLKINGELRSANASTIAELTTKSAPSKLWTGPFVQLGNSKVEAAFADHRTYVHKGAEIDRQVHLGFDLAVTAAVPIAAANAGNVLFAGWLGIYGNCVVLDHGMGVASLYGHLSSLDVKAGDTVRAGQVLGRSGMTGLAAGDHLHFTMLVAGRPVNPVEWWDAHWIEDRVERKLRAAANSGSTP
jgi:murein DD-endopeptidase MepM/ murein hydrolase activator NlpD